MKDVVVPLGVAGREVGDESMMMDCGQVARWDGALSAAEDCLLAL